MTNTISHILLLCRYSARNTFDCRFYLGQAKQGKGIFCHASCIMHHISYVTSCPCAHNHRRRHTVTEIDPKPNCHHEIAVLPCSRAPVPALLCSLAPYSMFRAAVLRKLTLKFSAHFFTRRDAGLMLHTTLE